MNSSLLQVFITHYINAEHGPGGWGGERSSWGRLHSWVRVVSGLVRQMVLHVWVKTDLAFLESLGAYPFNDQKLALLAFYLTTFARWDQF